MNKIAAYEMLLEKHPLWEKQSSAAGLHLAGLGAGATLGGLTGGGVGALTASEGQRRRAAAYGALGGALTGGALTAALPNLETVVVGAPMAGMMSGEIASLLTDATGRKKEASAYRKGLSPYDHVQYDSKREMVELIANTPPGGKKKIPWFARHLSPAELKRVRRHTDAEHGTDFSIALRPSVARQNPKLRPLVDAAVEEQLGRMRDRAMAAPSQEEIRRWQRPSKGLRGRKKEAAAPNTFGVYELPDRLRSQFNIKHDRPVLMELSDRDIAKMKQKGFSLPKRVSREVESSHWKARAKGASVKR